MNFKIFYVFVLILVTPIALAELNKQYTIDIDEVSSFTLPKGDLLLFKWPARNYMLPNATNEDILTFNIVDKEEKLAIRKIDPERDIVYLTVFIEDSETPYYPSINFNQFLKLDFEKDGLNDLIVRLKEIKDDNVTFGFEKIDNKDKVGNYDLILSRIKKMQNKTNEEAKADDNLKDNSFSIWGKFNFKAINNWYVIIAIILIFSLILYNKREIMRLYRKVYRRVKRI